VSKEEQPHVQALVFNVTATNSTLWVGNHQVGIYQDKVVPASRFSTQHSQQKVIFFCYRWWLVLQHKTTSKDVDVLNTSTDVGYIQRYRRPRTQNKDGW